MGCGFDSVLYSLPEPSLFPVETQQKYKKEDKLNTFLFLHPFV